MRAPCVIRWPGVIKPGTVLNDIFASLDWLPTLVDIAGGPKGNALNEQIMSGPVPRHRQDQARRRQPARLPDRQVGRSRRATSSSTTRARIRRRCATRTGRCTSRWCSDSPERLHLAGVNLSLDPGPQHQARSVRASGRSQIEDPVRPGRRASPRPSTAYIYDWNMLPIGQLLWLKELESYKEFPPMQDPASVQPGAGHGSGQEDANEPVTPGR